MVDLAEIGIGVDVAQVKTAKQELQALGTAFNSAERSAGVFTQTFDKAFKTAQKDIEYMRQSARAFQDIVNQANGVTKSYKSAEQSASAFIEVLRNQEAQAKKTALAINSITGVTGTRATSSGAGFGALDSEMARLESRFDGLKMASALYEKELNDLNMAQANGIRITGGYEAALEKLNLEYQQFQNGITTAGNRFEAQTQLNTKGMNQMGLATQQLGYQMGDFLVQVQSGTNWMVAFGQQATQAVAVLPMFATQLGLSATMLLSVATGLGVAIPLVTALGAAWMRTHEDNKKAASGLTDLENRLKSLDSTLKEWQLTKEAVSAGVSLEESIAGNGIDAAIADVKRLEEEIRTFSYGVKAGFIETLTIGFYTASEQVEAQRKALEENLAAAQQRLADLQLMQQEKATQAFLEENRVRSQGLALAETALKYGEDSVQVEERRRAQLLANYAIQNKGMENLADLLVMYEKQLDAEEKAKKEADALKVATENANKAAEIGVGIWEALKNKVADAAAQARAYASATALGASLRTLPDERGSQRGQVRSAAEYNTQEILDRLGRDQSGMPIVSSGNSGVGGGVGGAKGPSEETIENRLKKLYEYLGELEKFQVEAENIAYKQREDTLKQALDAKLITLQDYHEAEKALKIQHNEELRALQSQSDADSISAQQNLYKVYEDLSNASTGSQLGAWGNFFGSMAGLMQSGNERVLKIQKAFVAAQALIDAWGAYNKVLNDPTPQPWWTRLAAAANVLAAGFGAVNAIKGVTSGGGGSTSASTKTSTVTSSTQAAPQTYYISGLEPNSLYSGETLQNLFDAITKENTNRGGVFVFARQ